MSISYACSIIMPKCWLWSVGLCLLKMQHPSQTVFFSKYLPRSCAQMSSSTSRIFHLNWVHDSLPLASLSRSDISSIPTSNLVSLKTTLIPHTLTRPFQDLLIKSPNLHTLHCKTDHFEFSFDDQIPALTELSITADSWETELDHVIPVSPTWNIRNLTYLDLLDVHIKQFLGPLDFDDFANLRTHKIHYSYSNGFIRDDRTIVSIIQGIRELHELDLLGKTWRFDAQHS